MGGDQVDAASGAIQGGSSSRCQSKIVSQNTSQRQIANGYMVGACLAEYHKGKITKEDFNRGNGPANKAANWEFVQKFMKRRGFCLCPDDVECLCAVSGEVWRNGLWVSDGTDL